MSRSERADVVIVGGAIIGSSVATFLAGRPDFDGRILVVERDTTFRTSSTTLSAASIRMQFSTPLNVQISQFGVEFLKSLDRYLAVDGEAPEIDSSRTATSSSPPMPAARPSSTTTPFSASSACRSSC